MSTENQPDDPIEDAFRAAFDECARTHKVAKAIVDYAKWAAKKLKTGIIAHLKKRARRHSDIHRRRFHRNPKRRALRK